MRRPTRLIVADDHAIVRQGLIALLEDLREVVVVAQADSGREAVRLAIEHRPDIVLLDINLPDMSGLEAAQRITARVPRTEVLILTMHEEEAFFFEALRSGAAGYVLKGDPWEDLVSAILRIRDGGVYLTPRLAGSLVAEYLRNLPSGNLEGSLTPREIEVLKLIARGLTNRMIAGELSVSINTIKTHRSSIYGKLQINDRASLVAYALRNGLIQ